MPLIFFDLIKGRKPEEVEQILEVSHRVFVEVLDIPQGDRYQIVRQHEPYEMVIEDTGLGFERTSAVIVLTIVSRQRNEDLKVTLYRRLLEELTDKCGITERDLLISFTINDKDDWSFGFGRAQFLTGEL